MYTQPASALAPALIIYLIDASDSMNLPCGVASRIAVVNQTLRSTFRDMIRRSMREGVPESSYHIAIYAYSSKVVDVLGGIRDVPAMLTQGVPEIGASGATDTAAAFIAAEQLLQERLATYQHCTAPLVCHLTDGEFTTTDPSPIIRRIRKLRVEDGPVLVEHIYLGDKLTRQPVTNWKSWGGIKRMGQLTNPYARFLFDLASPLPESYRQGINTFGFALSRGTHLFFPGNSVELAHLAFVASQASPLT